MTYWVRFARAGNTGFGQIEQDTIRVYAGEMFGEHQVTEETLPLAAANLLSPCEPGKLLGLWNNFQQRATEEGFSRPRALK